MENTVYPQMNQVHLNYFKSLLVQEHSRLKFILEDFRADQHDMRGETSVYHTHMGENGSDSNEVEKAYFFASRETRALHEIEQALARIEQGGYGICLNCHQPIRRARLESIPYVSLCLNCENIETDF